MRISDMIIIATNNPSSVAYLSAGLFQSVGEWIHPQRVIDSYELIYVLEGTVYIQEEENTYALKKGDVLALTPGKKHWGTKQSDGKTSFYWVHFTTSDFSAFGLESAYFPALGKCGYTELFSRLLHVANTPGYPAYATDLIITLIINEIFMNHRESDNKSSKIIQEVSEWVRINSDTKISVENVANNFGYHPDYLSSLLKSSLGISLKLYINSERLKRCKNLLLSTKYSIKQIADQLGWKDENQFVHFFKYHEKITPTAFRNSMCNTHLNKR